MCSAVWTPPRYVRATPERGERTWRADSPALYSYSCLNGSIEGNRRGSELSRLIHRSMRHTLSLCSIATLYRSRKSISAAAFRPPVFTPLSVSPSGLRAVGYEKTVTGDPGSILDVRNGKATGCSTDGRWQHPALAAALPTPPMSPPFLMRRFAPLLCFAFGFISSPFPN